MSVSCKAMTSGNFCWVSGRSDDFLVQKDRQFHCQSIMEGGDVVGALGGGERGVGDAII